jgi:hypothetical protein
MTQQQVNKLSNGFKYLLGFPTGYCYKKITTHQSLSAIRSNCLCLSIAFLIFLPVSAQAGTYISNSQPNAHTGKIVIDGHVIGEGSDDIIEGSGKSAKESRTVSGYTKIEAHGGLNITYRQSRGYSLTLTADNNIIPIITTTVSGNSLMISTKKSYSSSLPISIDISSPELEAIYIDGSGDVTLNDIAINKLAIELNGSGKVSATGSVTDLDIKISGAGNIDSQALDAKNVSAHITGSGDLKVTAHDKLRAEILGTGDITYFGNPKTIEKNITGVGDISPGE